MGVLHYRRIERRRTMRVAICVDLLAQGEAENGEKFTAPARTLSVSGHGGMMTLGYTVVVGQKLILTNCNSGQSGECRVVSIKSTRDGQTNVAFEFSARVLNFWKMNFPAAGAKPLRRTLETRLESIRITG